jgi:hypothetical protein
MVFAPSAQAKSGTVPAKRFERPGHGTLEPGRRRPTDRQLPSAPIVKQSDQPRDLARLTISSSHRAGHFTPDTLTARRSGPLTLQRCCYA